MNDWNKPQMVEDRMPWDHLALKEDEDHDRRGSDGATQRTDRWEVNGHRRAPWGPPAASR